MTRKFCVFILLLLFAPLSIMRLMAGIPNEDYKKGVIYVSPKGSGNGTSWTSATGDLNNALRIAGKQSLDVYVSAGTYTGNKDSMSAFTMVEGVKVYGGFSGTETSLAERNLKKNKTILTGQDVQRVLFQSNGFTDSTMAVWDGFVIEHGTFKADDEYKGAGAYLRDYSALVNCEIRNNSSSFYSSHGLGVYMTNASHSTLENCLVHHNAVAKNDEGEYESGCISGIYVEDGGRVINCTVVENLSSDGEAAVGLYWNDDEMFNTIIFGNKNVNHMGEYTLSTNYKDNYSPNLHHCAIEGGVEDGRYVYGCSPSDFNDDYSLKAGSSFLDMGCAYESLTSVDVTGNKRIQGAAVDFGAIESSYSNPIKPSKEGVIYVKTDGSSTGSGSSWADATSLLQLAVNTASSYRAKVYVAAGTYKGDTLGRSAFTMVEGVKVYGGFAGTESNPDERNLKKNKTILTGQDVQRVLFQSNGFTDSTMAVWDGFVIEHGTFKADDEYKGAGVYLRDYSALVNCEIRNNSSSFYSSHGLGVYMTNAPHSTLENCLVHHNAVAKNDEGEYESGCISGICVEDGGRVINCTVVENLSSDGEAAVGLYWNDDEMFNTIIFGNKNVNHMGEYTLSTNYKDNNSPNLHHCAIEGGVEDGRYVYGCGPSDFNDDYSLKAGSPFLDMGCAYESLTSVDVTGNKRIQGAAVDFGAIESSYSNPIQPSNEGVIYVKTDGSATGSGSSWADATSLLQLAVNTASAQKAKVYVAAGTYKGDTTAKSAFTMVEGVEVYGGFAGTENSLSERDIKKNRTILTGQDVQRVLFQPNDFTDSTIAVWNGFVIEHGMFKEDDEYNGAGASLRDYSALVNCEIRENTSKYVGGYGLGAYMGNAPHSVLENCLIHHNAVAKNDDGEYVRSYGVGAYCSDGGRVVNCTVADNLSYEGESAVDFRWNDNVMINTVIYGNKNVDNLGESTPSNNFYHNYDVDVHHCAIEGGAEGQNIFGCSTNDFNGDYSPKAGSVCLDMGCDYEPLSSIDVMGNKRVQGLVVDLGAIESSDVNPIQLSKEGIIYVRADGDADGSGSSWKEATSLLQLAVNTASAQKAKVYVAAGTYKGDTTAKSAFTMVEGVEVYGGFAGTETSADERNLKKNKTILTGQDVQRVLFQPNDFTDSTIAVWNGFVIEHGMFKEDDMHEGAGVYLRDYSVLANCEVRYNTSKFNDSYGLGICLGLAPHSVVENCLVHHNSVGRYEDGNYMRSYGTGICSDDGCQIINCTVVDNLSSEGACAVDLRWNNNMMVNTIVYGNKNVNYSGEVTSPINFCHNYDMPIIHCAIEDFDSQDNGNIILASANNGNVSTQNYVRFINPTKQDYSLHATSACVDRGLDSVSATLKDIYSNLRVYNGRIDIGAIEWDGTYTSMQTYGQYVCSGANSKLESFDQVADHFEWRMVSNDGVEGFIESGEDTIPVMNLVNSTADTLHLIYLVTPYKDGEVKDSFEYDFTVLPLRSIGEIELYAPEDSVTSQYRSVYFDWNDVENATSYSLSFADSSKTWITVEAKTYTDYRYELDNHMSYRWFVTASNECVSKSSDTLYLLVEESSFIRFRDESVNIVSKLNSSDSLEIHVDGNELDKAIQLKWIGKDSASFSSSFTNYWDEKEGGLLSIYFHPTYESEKFNAQLVAFSESDSDTLEVIGYIPNYYDYTIKTDRQAYASTDTVIFSGAVSDMHGAAVANKEFEVYLIAQEVDYRRTFSVTTDDKGAFSFPFIPQYSETGNYTYGICLKGDGRSDEMGTFDIVGLQVVVDKDWYMTTEGVLTGKIYLRNKSRDASLTDLKIETVTLPENCKVQFDGVDTLKGGKSVNVNYEVQATDLSQQVEICQFKVVSKEGLSVPFSTEFFAKSKEAMLNTSLAGINTTMTKNATKTIAIPLYNNGSDATGEIRASLPSDFSWMSMMFGESIPELKAGDSTVVYLTLSPKDDIILNAPYKGTIYFNCEKGEALPLSFEIEAVSSEVGSLSLEILDEYYYSSPEHPHLSNATVLLQKMYASDTVAFDVTDETGLLSYDTLGEGTYLLTVRADHHSEYKEYISIDASRELKKQIFLNYQAVTYTWDVVRTEIEDEYQIDLIVTFETNVPVPSVTIDLNRQLPRLEDIQENEEVNFSVIMTNHGLIAAKDVEVNFPELDGYEIVPLFDKMDSLPAKYTQVIPAVLRKAKVTTRSGGGNYCVGISAVYSYICGGSSHGGSASTKQLWDYECSGSGFGAFGGWGGSGGGYGGFAGTGSGGAGASSTTDLCSVLDSLDCDPISPIKSCTMDALQALAPELGVIFKLYGCIEGASTGSMGSFVEGCATGFVPIPFFGCAKDLLKYFGCLALTEGGTPINARPGVSLRSYTVSNKSWLTDQELLIQSMMDVYMFNRIFEDRQKMMVECLGNESAFEKKGFNNFLQEIGPNLSNEEPIEWKTVAEIPESELSVNEMWAMAEHWNHSLEAWAQGESEPANLGNLNVIHACMDSIQSSLDYIEYRGYKGNVEAMINEAMDVMKVREQKHQSGVCAQVKLLISQTLTMTREAFEGTLNISNNRDTSLNAVDMRIEILDEDGNVANDLFQINVKSLSNISDVSGEGVLSSGQTGTAVFQFIPTKNAALTEPKHYSFGGTFSYVDPYTGDTIKNKMAPIWMTVQPSPNLVIDYFMQRDILGDDALTEDRVEPIVPAALGVLINNTGAGDAKNVMLSTAQPKIIDNEKGLLIDFKFIGSSLNGLDCQLGSEKINFGDIPAKSASVGVWWMTSSLMGLFVDYEASVTHKNSNGNRYLSLIDTVRIHELIHVSRDYKKGDSIPDFLVNDKNDAYHNPDILYLSDGTTEEVSAAKSGSFEDVVLSQQDSVLLLTVEPSKPGWNYLKMDDPSENRFEIAKVTRLSDGLVLPLDNFWQTHVTLTSSSDPVYENKFHFLDNIPTEKPEIYQIVFRLKRNTLDVISIDSVPENFTETPIKSLTVTFNEAIKDSTFDFKDLSLICQGQFVQLDSTLTIKKAGDARYDMDISAFTQVTGYYELTVNTNAIQNESGYEGYYGKAVSWVQMVDGVLVVADTVAKISDDCLVLNGKIEGDTKILAKGFLMRNVKNGEWKEYLCEDDSFMVKITQLEEEGDYEYKAFVSTEKAERIYGNSVRFHAPKLGNGLPTVSAEGFVSVYPNPMEDRLYISLPDGAHFVKLQTLDGKVVFARSYDMRQVTIDVSSLQSGSYLMIVSDKENNGCVVKLLKK